MYKTLELKKNIYWTGILDKDLKVFDIIMETEFGTSYNSYLVKGSEKTALIETAKVKFFDEYINELKQLTDISEIDYIIVNHTEPDHAGSVEKLLELNPRIKVVGTTVAVNFLKNIVNHDFTSIMVKENDTLSLGDKTFRFMALPNLHWPDTMYTYLEEDCVLFPCDSFGSHYSFDGILLSKVTDNEGYMRAAKYYFDNILGPFRPFVQKALNRIKNLRIDMICTGHGPVIDCRIDELVNIYREWSEIKNPNERMTVVIPYVSAYGYTRELAEKIEKGIRESGNIDVKSYDLVDVPLDKVITEIGYADGLLLGTPTILGEALKPIWDLTTSMYPVTHGGKLASAFGSYGWSGEGVPHLLERLKQLRMKVVEGLQVKLKPSETELAAAYEYGYNFGCILQGKENEKTASARKKLVKCLVCGEIFEEGALVCPVCGVGPENFVPVEDTGTDYQKNTKEIFLILGNGAAGVNAAEAIRNRNKTASIVMVTKESLLGYNRPMLTKSMIADFDPSQILIHNEDWYQERNIFNIFDRTVVSLDIKEREAVFEDGIKLKYDKLIYALGAESFRPPITGSDKNEVIAIRSVQDVERVKALLPSAEYAVVIGGGVLGLEAAWELRRSGCQVVVLETADRLMARQLDAKSSAVLKDIVSAKGIEVRCGVNTASIDGNGRVTGVTLEGGEEIPADLVIFSCGIRANSKIAMEAGIAVDRGVIVDERMQTNIQGIYACGDCAQFNGINYGIWPEAVEMGKAAGANAAGEEVAYHTVSPAITLHGMDTFLYAVGNTGNDPDKKYKTVEIEEADKKILEKYYFIKGRLEGAVIIGDSGKTASVTKNVEEHRLFKDMF